MTTYVWVYFWALYSVPLIYVSVFMPTSYYFDYCSFVISLEVREYDTSGFILSQNCFVIWGFCGFLLILGLFVLVVQLLSHVRLFVITRTPARQASLSFTISQSLFKLMSTDSVMPSNHLILCSPPGFNLS